MMALSYRKLVLASDLEPLSEIISDGKNGFLFETENRSDLSQKLDNILDNLGSLSSIRENSFDLLLTKYDWDYIGRLTKSSYQHVL